MAMTNEKQGKLRNDGKIEKNNNTHLGIIFLQGDHDSFQQFDLHKRSVSQPNGDLNQSYLDGLDLYSHFSPATQNYLLNKFSLLCLRDWNLSYYLPQHLIYFKAHRRKYW